MSDLSTFIGLLSFLSILFLRLLKSHSIGAYEPVIFGQPNKSTITLLHIGKVEHNFIIFFPKSTRKYAFIFVVTLCCITDAALKEM